MDIHIMVIKIIGIVFAVYCVYGATLFSVQRNFMYPRKYAQPPMDPAKAEGLEKIWFETDNGRVEMWYLPAVQSDSDRVDSANSKSAVIFTHGNAELIDYCLEEFMQYREMGVNLVLPEYPGYGRSEGRPSQRRITEVLVKTYDWLISEKSIDPGKIIVHGRSVGGGAACALVEERSVAGVILQSTFTNTKQFARGFLLPGFLIRDKFDNEKVLASFKGPVLIFHGKYDEVIPYDNGVVLSKTAENCTFIDYECRHNDLPPDRQHYWDKITKHLQSMDIID